MHPKFAYAGILLLAIGLVLYFYVSFSSSGLVKNGDIYLQPNSSVEVPVTFSFYYFGYYPNVKARVVGGEVVNVTTGYLPINGTYVMVRAFLIHTLGSESFVTFTNNYSSPIILYYGIRDAGEEVMLLGITRLVSVVLSLAGIIVIALYITLRRYKGQGE